MSSDFYSPLDTFNNEEGFEDGDADRSGHAIPLPPDSYSIHEMSNISEHPKFKHLLKVNSRCKGSRLLFEYLLGSSKVILHKMNNCLEYTSFVNPVFIECTTFPSHSFKDHCMNCFVCFTTDKMTYFKLGIIEGMHYNAPLQSDHIVDGILRIWECDDDFFWSGNARFSDQPQLLFMNSSWVLGEDDHHFSMYSVNKVMGLHLTSDKEDMVNKDDNCVQHSSFGKNGFGHFCNLQDHLYHMIS